MWEAVEGIEGERMGAEGSGGCVLGGGCKERVGMSNRGWKGRFGVCVRL